MRNSASIIKSVHALTKYEPVVNNNVDKYLFHSLA